jgi:hypothetical protein
MFLAKCDDMVSASWTTPRPRSGLQNKQIARVMEATVKVHHGEVTRKMRARSLAELVRMADKLRLYHPSRKRPRPRSNNPVPSVEPTPTHGLLSDCAPCS